MPPIQILWLYAFTLERSNSWVCTCVCYIFGEPNAIINLKRRMTSEYILQLCCDYTAKVLWLYSKSLWLYSQVAVVIQPRCCGYTASRCGYTAKSLWSYSLGAGLYSESLWLSREWNIQPRCCGFAAKIVMGHYGSEVCRLP